MGKLINEIVRDYTSVAFPKTKSDLRSKLQELYQQTRLTLLQEIKEKLPQEKRVCGCAEESDPQAPGYHTKQCDLGPYAWNSYRSSVLSLIEEMEKTK